MSIICGYALLRSEGYKGKRIHKVSQNVDAMERQYLEGNLDVLALADKNVQTFGIGVEYSPYTEKDIKFRKGTYNYWLDYKQMEAQNVINEFASRYLNMFFWSMHEMHGFGEKRMGRLYDELQKHLELYRVDKVTLRDWQKALYEDAGIWFALPEDPLTKTKGSIMTGM